MFPLSSQNIIGVDISDSSIEILGLKKIFRGPRVSSYNRMVLPSGVISDGNILRPEALSEALEYLLRTAKPRGLSRALCVVSLPDSQIFSSILHLPSSLYGASLRQAVLYEFETSYPLRLSEHYFDYCVVRNDRYSQDVLFVAAPRHLVQNYFDTLYASHLLPIAFDIESFSIGRAFLGKQDRHASVIIADLGTRSTNITVYSNNTPQIVRLISWGGERITKRISDALGIPEHLAEIEKRKCNIFAHALKKEVALIIEQELNSVVYELKKIIQWHLYNRKRDIGTIILSGGVSLTPGIRKYFQSKFRQNVEIRNPMKNILTGASRKKHGRFSYYANVLGLALRALSDDPVTQGINLLQKARVSSRVPRY